jgi:hypothetical protein
MHARSFVQKFLNAEIRCGDFLEARVGIEAGIGTGTIEDREFNKR